MKNLLKSLAVLAIVATAFSCSKKEAAVAEGTEPAAPYTVDSLLTAAPSLVGDTVTVEGVCSHLCKHGGRKAFLMGADSTVLLRCEATEAMGGAFSPDCPGKTLTVTGVVEAQRLGKSVLEQAAARENADTAHCDTERRATGSATAWLDSLNRQIAAGGDTTIVIGYYLDATSYSVPVE